MSRVALCVGIEYYDHANCPPGSVQDAQNMAKVLERHWDESRNFDVVQLLAEDESTAVSRSDLTWYAERLFADEHEIALFYFAGLAGMDCYHSSLATSDTREVSDGFSMDTLMRIVARSKAIHKIIILDCCHSGGIGNSDSLIPYSQLPENTTILAACDSKGIAYEGVFTPLVLNALTNGNANMLGQVTAGDIYSYVDRALGLWQQHPVFKANIRYSVCLRRNKPPIKLETLRRIDQIFPMPGFSFPLDPGFVLTEQDGEVQVRNAEHEEIFSILRQYESLKLVEPEGEENLYRAALNYRTCRLTPLGQYYWQLVATSRI